MSAPTLANAAPPVDSLGRVTTGEAAALIALASSHQNEQRIISRTIQESIALLWNMVDFTNLSASWAALATRAKLNTTAAQTLAAKTSAEFVARSLRVQGIDVEAPQIDAASFAGYAADGRSLDGLLLGGVISAKRGMALGQSREQALIAGERYLRLAVQGEVVEAQAGADRVSMIAATQGVTTGWVRMLNPPSCGRCAVLAGQFYRWNQGFQRHQMCWPEDTIISGPEILAASRRSYEGQLVTIRTAGGKKLSVTANHPVLTMRGWIPAQFLKEGDQVLTSSGGKGASALMVPNHDQVPARIQDIATALRVSGLLRHVPSTTKDFHGDGSNGEVDVVYSDRLLRYWIETMRAKHSVENQLALRSKLSIALAGGGASKPLFESRFSSSCGGMSCGDLGSNLLFGHLGSSVKSGFGPVAWADSGGQQCTANPSPVDPELERYLKLAHPIDIGGDGSANVEAFRPGPRWDAPADPVSMQDGGAYAGSAFDLFDRLSGQVETDCVVDVNRVNWSGHVYSLTSAEGWVCSDNIITSNCDCVHIPSTEAISGDVTTDPQAYFDSLSPADQAKYFGKANAEAIDAGANIGRVIRGATRQGSLYTIGGRRYTREDTSKRGYYKKQTTAGKAGAKRLTPYQIIKDANGSKGDAMRLLVEYGYIVR